jgi:hypothetical protein
MDPLFVKIKQVMGYRSWVRGQGLQAMGLKSWVLDNRNTTFEKIFPITHNL